MTQQAITIMHNGMALRGMEHIPPGENLPAVILYHGFTGTKLEPHRLFLKISRALEEKGIASFRFDFLGSGESDGDFEDMTVMNELSEARTIFDYVKAHPAVDGKSVSLLGLSMGGLVASLLAGELKEQVDKLILMAPAGTMSRLAEEYSGSAPYIPDIDAYDLGGNAVGKNFIEELSTIDVWKKAADYRNKVLLIHGTNDETVPFGVSSLYITNCYQDNAVFHPIEGAGHTFNSYQWEQEVIRLACDFMTANGQ
jgi:pimeloyl-ACP methyl ester carboxylesterase